MQGTHTEAFNCKPCQCYSHADSCVYDAAVDDIPDSYTLGSGGMCVNCEHHTTGRMCDTCEDHYFRPEGVSLFDINVCQSCQCNSIGVLDVNTPCARVGAILIK